MNSVLVNYRTEVLQDEDTQCIEYICTMLVDSQPKDVSVTSYVPLEVNQLINKANEQLRFTNPAFQQKVG